MQINPEFTERDRVRRHTAADTCAKIDDRTRRNIRAYARLSDAELGRRIAALEREWDVERVLETNASLLALTGAILGTTVNKRWFAVTAVVLGFLTQHALSGWCPPVPLIRRLGVRTRSEIDQEKYALKALRGDFAVIEENDPGAVDAAVDAATV